ncbi:hypothetical protein [Sphingosinicella terrae]|uniref:hypothetical protein n=1 Tax=Sphingosinicella terrae TaxID=2172047 RepID=UPI000E0D3E18|nr:hypothetical protein [Sphingosinicella terrae]
MSHQAPLSPAASGADPGRQIAQLREALRLVERIAGRPPAPPEDSLLDEAARIGDAYDRALPIVQRRFDALAGETAAWAAAGVEALLAAAETAEPRAAAARLAAQLERALSELMSLLRPWTDPAIP